MSLTRRSDGKSVSLNVAMVAYAFYETDRRIRNYAEALQSSGANVDVFSLRKEGEEEFGRIENVNVYKILERDCDAKGPIEYASGMMRFFIKGSIRLLLKHAKHRYDLIHVHNVPDFLVFMGLGLKLLGAKVVLDIHDILPEFFCQKFERRMDSFAAKILLLIERLSVKFADHVIVANHIWQQKIVSRNALDPGKVSVFLNYPDLKKFRFVGVSERRNGHWMIYPGTVSKRHGVDIAIRAMMIVKKSLPDAQLHIYGRTGSIELSKHVEDLIRSLGLEDFVSLHREVSPEELKQIYGRYQLGLVPKRRGVFTSEAFSSKVFDFFASGLPVVISRTAIDEFYFDESLVSFFEPEDEIDLARAVTLVMTDMSLRERLTRNGMRYATENSWEAKKQTYLDLLQRVVDKHPIATGFRSR